MLHHYNPSTLPCYQRCYLCAVKYPQPPKSKEEQAKLSHCQSLSRALKLMFFEAWHCAATCPILGPQEPAEFRVPPDSTSLLPASWKHTDCLKTCRCSAANILVCKMKHLWNVQNELNVFFVFLKYEKLLPISKVILSLTYVLFLPKIWTALKADYYSRLFATHIKYLLRYQKK